MKIAELIHFLEELAPPALQEGYDNSGLLTGAPHWEITRALLTLDCTEAVVEEAIANGCNLIIAHHPIIFGGLKRINGKNYVERTVIAAIKHDIAIYAIHTNLDNIAGGVNRKIAQRLGLVNCSVLEPKPGSLVKLVTFVPVAHLEAVKNALFEAGAGHIGNYSECSFGVVGTGTFKAGPNATPFTGNEPGQHREAEIRIETIFPAWLKEKVVSSLLAAHPYEEVAYDLYALLNTYAQTGSGLLGNLPGALAPEAFLAMVKSTMETPLIRFTRYGQPIKRVAVCGGAGSFLLRKAIAAGAQAFVTADFKYHEFFDADEKLMIADIGHYESEKFTKTLLSEVIVGKFPTFALLLSKINTNPVNYYT